MSAAAAGAGTAAAGDAKAPGRVRQIAAGVLDVGYADIGPPGGRAVLLLQRLAAFPGKYLHHTLTGGIGHNPPQEAPAEFAAAIEEADSLATLS